jgi:hypothetical protein
MDDLTEMLENRPRELRRLRDVSVGPIDSRSHDIGLEVDGESCWVGTTTLIQSSSGRPILSNPGIRSLLLAR